MQNYFHNVQVPCYCCVTWYETRTTFFASLFALEAWTSAGGGAKRAFVPPWKLGQRTKSF